MDLYVICVVFTYEPLPPPPVRKTQQKGLRLQNSSRVGTPKVDPVQTTTKAGKQTYIPGVVKYIVNGVKLHKSSKKSSLIF